MRNQKARKIALTGMLFALAMALSFFEAQIAPFLGLPGGIKLGLANVVVMFCVLFVGRAPALSLVILKAAFSCLRGPTAGLLSLLGGLVSLLILVLLSLPKKSPSLLILSIAGALGHNMGQFIGARFIFGIAIIYNLPVLIIAGIVMGTITSLLLKALLPALKKAGLGKR